MNKHIIYILSLILFAACKGKQTSAQSDSLLFDTAPVLPKIDTSKKAISKDTAFKPYTVINDFIITDTGYFDFGLGEGTYAVVKKDNKLLDTIDQQYGIQKISNDVYLYLVIDGKSILTNKENEDGMVGNNHYKKSIFANIGDFIILNKGNKISLNNKAEDFGWFANPAIINQKIYYWKVSEAGTNNRVFAAMFDPLILKTTSHYLFNDLIETDDGGYFESPQSYNGQVIFQFKGKRYKFSPDLTLK
ncbi:hypothetical protein LJ707_00405 [Mucilaginibacter sp. UR6-1]|uniref:hypothetical protein n=1 Tax=Mucilaginibacter sp. UR6-1 TaxID=1435643 RepID=UPI001E482125|nr:hypothetical protein [Mucilaginibacter sp. UR6-1]MCC8407372.1 hypothetical protein [Mucilaginibacter sp. UR6-1]